MKKIGCGRVITIALLSIALVTPSIAETIECLDGTVWAHVEVLSHKSDFVQIKTGDGRVIAIRYSTMIPSDRERHVAIARGTSKPSTAGASGDKPIPGQQGNKGEKPKGANSYTAYDNLSSENIQLKARTLKAGNALDYSYYTSWGSYNRDRTISRTILVENKGTTRSSEETLIEFFTFIEDLSEDKVRAERQRQVDDDGKGEWLFGMSAERNETDYWGTNPSKRGEKIQGWAVRAIRGDQIIGVAASSEKLRNLAASGAAFEGIEMVDAKVDKQRE